MARAARLRQLRGPTLADDGEPLVRADALDGQGKAALNRGPRWDLLNRV